MNSTPNGFLLGLAVRHIVTYMFLDNNLQGSSQRPRAVGFRLQNRKEFIYEEALPKKPYPVVYKTLLPKHYRISQLIDARDIAYAQDTPQLLKTHIENRMLQELRPLIWDNLKTEKDFYSDKYRYWLDIWVESNESEGTK